MVRLCGELNGMLMFRPEIRERVAMGEITVSYRFWKYAHVKAGKTYATGFGDVSIEEVQLIPAALVPEEDVERAGCQTVEEVWHSAGDHSNTTIGPDTMLYRVQFRFLDGPPVKSG